jgi:hypothetical protein
LLVSKRTECITDFWLTRESSNSIYLMKKEKKCSICYGSTQEYSPYSNWAVIRLQFTLGKSLSAFLDMRKKFTKYLNYSLMLVIRLSNTWQPILFLCGYRNNEFSENTVFLPAAPSLSSNHRICDEKQEAENGYHRGLSLLFFSSESEWLQFLGLFLPTVQKIVIVMDFFFLKRKWEQWRSFFSLTCWR